MKWKTVAAIIEPQNNDPKDLLNRSFSVSLIITTTPVVTWSSYMHRRREGRESCTSCSTRAGAGLRLMQEHEEFEVETDKPGELPMPFCSETVRQVVGE